MSVVPVLSSKPKDVFWGLVLIYRSNMTSAADVGNYGFCVLLILNS